MIGSFIHRLYFLYLFGMASGIYESAAGDPRPSFLSSDTVHFVLSNGLLIWTLVLVYPVYESVRNTLLSQKWLLVLYLLAAISCSWSVEPVFSLRLIFLPLVLLVGGAYISLIFSPEEIVDLVAKVSALFAIGSVVGQFMMNPIVTTLTGGGWTGLYGHKNYLGVGMSIGIAALLASRSRWNVFRWCVLFLFVVVLLLSQSATAVVSSAAVFAVFLFRKLPRFAQLSLPPVAAFAAVLLVWTSKFDNLIRQVFGLLNRDTTFTGRTDIWYFDSTQIATHPVFGYGFEGYWGPHKDIVIAKLGWFPGQAHNGFLDTLLSFGISGLFVLLVVLWDAVRFGLQARARWGEFASAWLLLVIGLEFLCNLTSTDYMEASPLWMLFILALFSCSVAVSKRSLADGEDVAPNIVPIHHAG